MSIQAIIAAVIIPCAILVLYHHVVFPLLLKLLARRAPRSVPKLLRRGYRASEQDARLPSVTVVIPAYNEETFIADKIRNLAALDYPEDKLKAIIVCDGCTDNTADVARAERAKLENCHLSLRIVELAENRGKVSVLNDAIASVHTELVALSDVSALISLDALLVAAEHFSDPEVGVVAATYRMVKAGSAGENTYWRYQTSIKEGESALGAPLGVHGAFYLFRHNLFRALASDTINDDFILPMDIVAQGYRAVYDPEIVAVELECAEQVMDHRRRRRIGAGNLQQAIRMRKLLHPRFRGIAFAFASGKALRAVMPLLLLTLFVGSFALAFTSSFFAALFALQCMGYGIAMVRHAVLPKPVPRLIDIIHYLVSGHVAGLIGGARYLMGLERGRWHRVSS